MKWSSQTNKIFAGAWFVYANYGTAAYEMQAGLRNGDNLLHIHLVSQQRKGEHFMHDTQHQLLNQKRTSTRLSGTMAESVLLGLLSACIAFGSGCQKESVPIDLSDLERNADVIRRNIDNGVVVADRFGRIPRAEIPTILPGVRPNFVEDFGVAIYFDFGNHIAADGYMVFGQEAIHAITSQPPMKVYKTELISPRTDRIIGEY